MGILIVLLIVAWLAQFGMIGAENRNGQVKVFEEVLAILDKREGK